MPLPLKMAVKEPPLLVSAHVAPLAYAFADAFRELVHDKSADKFPQKFGNEIEHKHGRMMALLGQFEKAGNLAIRASSLIARVPASWQYRTTLLSTYRIDEKVLVRLFGCPMV